nr:MAG TPA: hypothetical protein [Caudoviricetes sp.]
METEFSCKFLLISGFCFQKISIHDTNNLVCR